MAEPQVLEREKEIGIIVTGVGMKEEAVVAVVEEGTLTRLWRICHLVFLFRWVLRLWIQSVRRLPQ